MAFLSCEEMAAARSQKITLVAKRSDLESCLTEAHSRAAMRHLWQVMQANSQGIRPRAAQPQRFFRRRCRQGRAGVAAVGRFCWAMTICRRHGSETAECNACMKRIVGRAHGGQLRVLLPAVLLPGSAPGRQTRDAVCDALYVAAGLGSSPPAPRWRAQRAAVRPEVGAASAILLPPCVT